MGISGRKAGERREGEGEGKVLTTQAHTLKTDTLFFLSSFTPCAIPPRSLCSLCIPLIPPLSARATQTAPDPTPNWTDHDK